jgi:hypothetical protein
VHAVLWVLVVLMLELVVALVLLGTWVAEGRRRAEEIERLSELTDRLHFADAASVGARDPSGLSAKTRTDH